MIQDGGSREVRKQITLLLLLSTMISEFSAWAVWAFGQDFRNTASQIRERQKLALRHSCHFATTNYQIVIIVTLSCYILQYCHTFKRGVKKEWVGGNSLGGVFLRSHYSANKVTPFLILCKKLILLTTVGLKMKLASDF